MARHLDLNDRIAIQSGLKEGKNIATIATELNRDKATISREIRSKRQYFNFQGRKMSEARSPSIRLQRLQEKAKVHFEQMAL